MHLIYRFDHSISYRFHRTLQGDRGPKLLKRATNLFYYKTLAIHPVNTIFGTFTLEVRREMNVSDNTIRIFVGLESVEDLLADFEQALNNS